MSKEEFDWHKIDQNDSIMLTRINRLERLCEALSKKLEIMSSEIGKIGLRAKNLEDEYKVRRNSDY